MLTKSGEDLGGTKVVDRCRRKVSRLFTASTSEQKPKKGSVPSGATLIFEVELLGVE